MPLAHALPLSVGAFPLTLLLTLMLAVFLAVNATATRRVLGGGGRGADGPSGGAAGGAGWQDLPAMSVGGEAVGWALLLSTLALTLLGPSNPSNNITDTVVLKMAWGAVGLTSIAFGPWWPAVNPVAAASRTFERLAGPAPRRELSAPVALGGLLVLLLGWAWVQLAVITTNLLFACLLLGYVVANLLAVSTFGPRWLEEVEPVTVLSRTMGLLRPGGEGPVARLSGLADSARLHLIAAALIGWSLTDLVLETEWWHDLGLRPAQASLLEPAVLLAVVGLLLLAIRGVSGRVGMGPAFVAVAAGWLAAHYLSILIIDGQGIPIWLSDPFDSGADLLGRRGDLISLEPLPVELMTVIQMVPFVAGHALAGVVTQRRAAAVAGNAAQVGALTLLPRALVVVLLLGGGWMQLGGL